ncbi:MAG: DUF1449 family protein [Clostridiaceae bacterium]|jgi:hypothetical protein|nr:DUF1449 family protein [Clostridiaceae bacterium]
MLELFKLSITGINIIPSVLLGIIVLYWLSVIIGAIDIDLFDFDLDLDLDLDIPEGEVITSPFHGFLAFLNVGEIPFMIVLSVFCLSLWTISMIIAVLPIVSEGLINAILIIPNIIVSLFITKAVTHPLKGLFKGVMRDVESDIKIEGQLCTLLSDIKYGRLGQAEIERLGSSILINVKVQEQGETLLKGDKAIVLKKVEDRSYYIIKKFEGVR